MSLADIQRAHREQLEQHLDSQQRLLGEVERTRDLTTSPIERARLDEDVSRLKGNIERYSQELAEVDAEIKAVPSSPARRPSAPNPPYRVALDESLSLHEQERLFRAEVEDIVLILDYRIENGALTGVTSDDFPMFVAVQDGDFEPLRCLFGTTCGLVDDRAFSKFRVVYDLNRSSRGVGTAILVTNTYVTPSARQLAAQSNIQILAYGELLDRVFKFSPYLRAKCHEYEQQGTLVHTYVDVKYMRRGSGSYPDARATPEEILVTATSVAANAKEGSEPSFEAKAT